MAEAALHKVPTAHHTYILEHAFLEAALCRSCLLCNTTVVHTNSMSVIWQRYVGANRKPNVLTLHCYVLKYATL